MGTLMALMDNLPGWAVLLAAVVSHHAFLPQSDTKRESFLRETAHHDVCGLSRATGLCFLEIDIAVEFYTLYEHHKPPAIQFKLLY